MSDLGRIGFVTRRFEEPKGLQARPGMTITSAKTSHADTI
jgi:hypothetical protein